MICSSHLHACVNTLLIIPQTFSVNFPPAYRVTAIYLPFV